LKRTGLDGEKLFFFLAQERQGRVGGFLISWVTIGITQIEFQGISWELKVHALSGIQTHYTSV
jgi:hypothetical protein